MGEVAEYLRSYAGLREVRGDREAAQVDTEHARFAAVDRNGNEVKVRVKRSPEEGKLPIFASSCGSEWNLIGGLSI